MNFKLNYATAAVGFIIFITFVSAVAGNNGLRRHLPSSVNNGVFHQGFDGFTGGLRLPAALPQDTPRLRYPLQDNQNGLQGSTNPFDLTPSNIEENVEYDPDANQYVLIRTIGNQFYGDPTYMSFQEYLNYQSQKQNQEYFAQKSDEASLLDRRGIMPPVNVNVGDRLFGGTNVDIRPQGNIELTFGGNFTNIQNPSLTEQQRRQGGFNFDMNIQMNVVGKIGEKLKLTTNYNTQAQFDFEKQVKLEYTGYPDEIIKKIEAGNVSFPLTTSLITGSQSLFGLKTQLQFGRLMVTSVLSEQKSQTQNITVQGGKQTQTFSVAADQYDENRNFFLAHYFRDRYNQNMARIPVITSPINITKVEVWVTNKTGATIDTRDIVAFQDLAEYAPYSPQVQANPGRELPHAFAQEAQQNTNTLYQTLTSTNGARGLNTAVSTLTSQLGLVQVQDFEKTYARKLAPTEYTVHPQLGYVMLNSQLNPDEIMAVAYQYTHNGQVYQVGEFASDVPPDPSNANVLFVKLLKSTSVRPKLPMWDLMMKNVYSLGAWGIGPEDFFLDVVYLDPGGGRRRFIPAGPINGTPLIRVLGLDRLNTNQDPQPDGIFDFIPGITINPQNGKLIFPVLEPFGTDLQKAFGGDPVASRYVYQVLYDSTKTVALQFPEYNRFYMEGQYQSAATSDISLGAFNIPQGSVSVTAGGQVLIENVHYTIDYNLGRLKIIDAAILNSGVPVSVKFENNPMFVFNKKTLFATRLDYYINDQFKLGGTYMRLSERPYTRKLNVGEDPIANAIYGTDMSWQRQSGWVTRMVDKIPLIDTKDPSTVTFTAEGAKLVPGHSKAIGKNGQVYIDDFEGTQSSYDLKFPFISWSLSSAPTNHFPEASLVNDLAYGFRRAKLQWYNIDPYFYSNNAPSNIRNNAAEQFGLYTRQMFETDLFPQKPKLNQNGLPPILTTFDLHYDPSRRGPYNFRTENVNDDGTLQNPEQNWGGIMRALDYNDFEAANIEFIQFWVLDPYLEQGGGKGNLYIQLGNISEDILKDSRLFFENALPPNGPSPGMQTSVWSFFPPQNQPPITNSFDNSPTSRQFQDVGLDGANNSQERDHFSAYLSLLQATAPGAYNAALADPSSDDYRYYKDASYDAVNAGIIERYRDYNNPENNSPIPQGNQNQSFAATNIPDSEDLNRDNTLSETEEFFEYRFSLDQASLLSVGQNFITDVVETQAKDNSGNVVGTMRWLQVKIPLNEYVARTGGIQDFKSIRFIRVFVSGAEQPVTLRFGKLELLRNQWRRYNFSLQSPGEYVPNDNSGSTYFNVSSVSFEENGTKQPVNYVLPPGIEQEQAIGTVNQYLQNEQALAVQVCDLPDGDARAAYKTLNLDLRTFDSLKMYVHAEHVIDRPQISDRDITAFIRLGSDFVGNYYEYEIPLIVTPAGTYNNNSEADRYAVWPLANNFTIDLKKLTSIKQERNLAGASPSLPFTIQVGNARVTLVGNPDLGLVKVAMLGVRNPKQGNGVDPDDAGVPVCAEVWFNELRVSGFDEEGGYAALARADVKLADLGSVTVAGTMHTIGFGTLEQKLNERYRDNYYQYDASTTLELSKFLPARVGLRLPLYAGISRSFSNPKYDPYELDVLLKDKLALVSDKDDRDSIRRAAQHYTSIKSLNFTNVRRVNPNKQFQPRFYSVENLNATYAYTKTFRSNPIIQSDDIDRHHAQLGYAFPGKSQFIQPFNKPFASRTGKYWKPVKDFNFNLMPTNLMFRTTYDRQMGETMMRPRYKDDIIEPTYNKFFTNDRFYGAKLDLTRALSIDYSAVNNARFDEPYGKIDTKEKKDSIWTNVKKFGRNTHFHQTANASYTLPFNKLPITDWMTGTARYTADYDWLAAPQVLDTIWNADSTVHSIRQVDNPLGNVIANGQNITLSGDLNLRNLYGKSKWLKRYDTNYVPPRAPVAPRGGQGARGDQPQAQAQDNKKQPNTAPPKAGPATFGLRLLTSVKKVNLSFTQNRSTTLPGFNYRSQLLGHNFSHAAPSFDFITGFQPDTSWLYDAAAKGWLTNDPTMNYQFIQTLNRTYTARATVEPIKDFNIDINFNRTYTQNTNAIFRNVNEPQDPMYRLLNPQQAGTYSITYLAIGTAFARSDSGYSPLFNNFSDYRRIMSQRWAQANPNADPNEAFYNPIDETTNPEYAQGYGPYAQEVLIPAFLAAYSGRDPNKEKLGNPFRKLPLPNWRVTYNGLGKLQWAKKYFTNVNLTHGYTSTLSIGSYSTRLNFAGERDGEIALPSRIDESSGNFISYYDIPGISISERFSPLIGIDIRWKSGLNTKLDFGKGRNLAMSFLNYQLAETRTTDLTLSLGYKWKKAPIPFKIRGKKQRLPNDLNLALQTGMNRNETNNFMLDLNQPGTPSMGNTTIQFSPSVDYQVNQRLNVRLFFDKRYTIPSTSASFPINYTNAGATIRFTLQ